MIDVLLDFLALVVCVVFTLIVIGVLNAIFRWWKDD